MAFVSQTPYLLSACKSAVRAIFLFNRNLSVCLAYGNVVASYTVHALYGVQYLEALGIKCTNRLAEIWCQPLLETSQYG